MKTFTESAMEACLELYRADNNHPSKQEICKRLYNGHSNSYTMASFNLLRVRDLLMANGASMRVVAVNHLYSHRRPPTELAEVQQCVRFGKGRPAMRLVFVRPTDESSRLLFEVSVSENGLKGARKLAEVGKRITQAVEEDCITLDRARTISQRFLNVSTPTLFDSDTADPPDPRPLPSGVTKLIAAPASIYLVGQCRSCGMSLTSPDPTPINLCSKCEPDAP